MEEPRITPPDPADLDRYLRQIRDETAVQVQQAVEEAQKTARESLREALSRQGAVLVVQHATAQRPGWFDRLREVVKEWIIPLTPMVVSLLVFFSQEQFKSDLHNREETFKSSIEQRLEREKAVYGQYYTLRFKAASEVLSTLARAGRAAGQLVAKKQQRQYASTREARAKADKQYSDAYDALIAASQTLQDSTDSYYAYFTDAELKQIRGGINSITAFESKQLNLTQLLQSLDEVRQSLRESLSSSSTLDSGSK